ncbi:MAG: hypothetical protein FD145_1269 [Candidatus Saganbacteria bacterium]|uniref:Flagellar hook-basal body complex protein FliE n=1 Tax=Candidatus Saganbacteria bacterium TaxID=2575572 RepID=A0A833P2U9_UNCSA|nr:MAG: hypothetical protein FD145_1269 [Candidatus Saganbacteria bacterium]
MVEGIDPLSYKLAQLMGEEAPVSKVEISENAEASPFVSDNPFEKIFSRAVDALEGVSEAEKKSNYLISEYLQGRGDIQDVMVQSSKVGIMVQLASTTINLAVSTFKEITQMQV